MTAYRRCEVRPHSSIGARARSFIPDLSEPLTAGQAAVPRGQNLSDQAGQHEQHEDQTRRQAQARRQSRAFRRRFPPARFSEPFGGNGIVALRQRLLPSGKRALVRARFGNSVFEALH